MWKNVLLLFIIAILLIPNISNAGDDEFVLGLWHTFTAGCIGGREIECCEDTLWGLDTISVDEQDLFDEIQTNTLHSHFYGEDDINPVMNWCNDPNVDVKVYLGVEARIDGNWGYENPYNEYTWWTGTADEHSQTNWQNGVDSTLAIYDDVHGYFGSNGLRGIYINHESWPDTTEYPDQYAEYLEGWGIMMDSVRNHDPNSEINTVIVDLIRKNRFPAFADSLSDLDVFEYERYMFEGDMRTSFTGSTFQSYIDTLFWGYADSAWENFKETNTRWMPVLWVGSRAWLEQGGTPCEDEDYITLAQRWPTREEIRLQAFLALAAGAKGIVVFTYSTVEDNGKIWGLLEYSRETPTKTDPMDTDDYLTGIWSGFYNDYVDLPFDHVEELFEDLQVWGDYFLPLYVEQHYFRANLVSDTSDIVVAVDSSLLAVTTFTDTTHIDETRYFMLVNRVTSDANDYDNVAIPQYPTVDIKMPTGNAYILMDMFSEKHWVFTEPDSTVSTYDFFSFTDTIDAGDGILYRIWPGRRGTLEADMSFYKYEILSGDYVVPSNVTLTIDEGTTVYVMPDSSITLHVNGDIEAIGTSSDSIYFLPYEDTPTAGDWEGIYIEGDGTFEYCSISYADNAIELRTDSEVDVYKCNLYTNETSGIYNYKGYLDLSYSDIDNNGTYGLYGLYAVDTVTRCSFYGNEIYGIHISGTTSSNEDSKISNVDIDYPSSMDDTQYGIYIQNNDYVTISSTNIRHHKQGGVRLYNSDADLTKVYCISNNYYGLYADYYSAGKIRICKFDSTITGVRSTDYAHVDLGDTSTTDGNNMFLECSSRFIYFDNSIMGATADTLWAQMNWYGSASPSRNKFVTDRRERIIMWEPVRQTSPNKLLVDDLLPTQFALRQNYPNPFNPVTTIEFDLVDPAYTVVTIYNILGQRVSQRLNQYLNPGSYSILWDSKNASGEPVASGVYFYTVQSGEYYDSRKMLLLR